MNATPFTEPSCGRLGSLSHRLLKNESDVGIKFGA